VLTPRFGVTRRVLFERPYLHNPWYRSFDLSRDGRHLLVVRSVATEQPQLVVVHNWAAEVRARARGSGQGPTSAPGR